MVCAHVCKQYCHPSLIINHKAERRWEINYPIGQKMGENLNKINKKGRIRGYGLFGVRRRIRTADLQSRSLTLYPAGLYVLVVFFVLCPSREFLRALCPLNDSVGTLLRVDTRVDINPSRDFRYTLRRSICAIALDMP